MIAAGDAPAAANPYAGGVKVPPITVDLAGMAPCDTEDGSGPAQALPCYWDAGTAGNGVGHSYWIGRPTRSDPDQRLIFTYLDPADQVKWGGR